MCDSGTIQAVVTLSSSHERRSIEAARAVVTLNILLVGSGTSGMNGDYGCTVVKRLSVTSAVQFARSVNLSASLI